MGSVQSCFSGVFVYQFEQVNAGLELVVADGHGFDPT